MAWRYVLSERQKGFVVAPISQCDLEDLTKVRIEIECRCLASSMERGDVNWEGQVLSIQHRLPSLNGAVKKPESAEAKQWHVLHKEFHDELKSACTRRWWLRLRQQLYTQSERYRRLSRPADESDQDLETEHDSIANAAIVRDSETARQHMQDHLQRTTEILLASNIRFSDGLKDQN